jgi:pimeloyl-ACP methyl ester carboxylesterase
MIEDRRAKRSGSRGQKIGAALFAALLIVSAIEELRYYRYGLSLVHPARRISTRAERDRARALGGEEVSFESQGATLRGTFFAPKNGAVVVMAHGLGEDRFRWLDDVEILQRHGYGALIYDARAHGESGGDTATWGDLEQRDVRAAIDFVMPHATKIVTAGFSVGSSAVFLEAAGDERVRAIVIEALWPSLDEEMEAKAGTRGFFSHAPVMIAMKRTGHVDFSRVRPIDHASDLGARPKLFIAGSEDSDTPPPIMERMMDHVPEPKRLWIVPGATHGSYLKTSPAEYERTLIEFLDRAL